MRIIVLVFSFLLLMSISMAHPHLFIEGSLTLRFDEAGLTAIEEHWTFDEMFSASMIEEFDINKDGRFDEQESVALKQGAFDNLKEFNYFTFVKSDGKAISIKNAEHFSAEIINDKLVYHFTVPCLIRVESIEKKMTIALFDTSYFTAITTNSTLGGLEDHPGLESTISFHQNKNYICFEDSGFPEYFTLKVRKKE